MLVLVWNLEMLHFLERISYKNTPSTSSHDSITLPQLHESIEHADVETHVENPELSTHVKTHVYYLC